MQLPMATFLFPVNLLPFGWILLDLFTLNTANYASTIEYGINTTFIKKKAIL